MFIKTFCHRKYLNRRIVYSSGHQGTFDPAVITNKEVHMVHGNINTTRLHIPLVMQRRDLLKFLITFPNQMENLLYLVSKLCIIFATFFWICSIIELFPVTFSCEPPPKRRMCETINFTSEVQATISSQESQPPPIQRQVDQSTASEAERSI